MAGTSNKSMIPKLEAFTLVYKKARDVSVSNTVGPDLGQIKLTRKRKQNADYTVFTFLLSLQYGHHKTFYKWNRKGYGRDVLGPVHLRLDAIFSRFLL